MRFRVAGCTHQEHLLFVRFVLQLHGARDLSDLEQRSHASIVEVLLLGDLLLCILNNLNFVAKRSKVLIILVVFTAQTLELLPLHFEEVLGVINSEAHFALQVLLSLGHESYVLRHSIEVVLEALLLHELDLLTQHRNRLVNTVNDGQEVL